MTITDNVWASLTRKQTQLAKIVLENPHYTTRQLASMLYNRDVSNPKDWRYESTYRMLATLISKGVIQRESPEVRYTVTDAAKERMQKK